MPEVNAMPKVDSNARVVLTKNGVKRTMSFGAFDREQREAMPMARLTTLHAELLSGKSVEVPLVDSRCRVGTVQMAEPMTH